MSPHDYITARQDSQAEDVFMVDDRPYYPALEVDPVSLDSVKQVTATVLFGQADLEGLRVLDVIPVKGGNTNSLFRIFGLQQMIKKLEDSQVRDDNDNYVNAIRSLLKDRDSVLMRVFGAEGLIDRNVETATYAALARQSMIPEYFGRFANGRLEGWLENMRPLLDRELASPDISKLIAREMAHLHASFQIPKELTAHHDLEQPGLWKEIWEWMQQALAISQFKSEHDNDRAKELLDLQKLPAELTWLQNDIIPKDCPVAFCHNDVLASNIMFAEKTQEIQLIDFEYGGINYRANDIANHFNEFAGGTDTGYPKYEWFPSKGFQLEFIRQYLESFASYNNQQSAITETEVISFYEQVQAFVLVNHLYWGLWGVNQAATEGCQDFDYLVYGSLRVQQYYVCKDKFSTKP